MRLLSPRRGIHWKAGPFSPWGAKWPLWHLCQRGLGSIGLVFRKGNAVVVFFLIGRKVFGVVFGFPFVYHPQVLVAVEITVFLALMADDVGPHIGTVSAIRSRQERASTKGKAASGVHLP